MENVQGNIIRFQIRKITIQQHKKDLNRLCKFSGFSEITKNDSDRCEKCYFKKTTTQYVLRKKEES